MAEDIAWARDVLLAGYRLAYVPAATVVHSHDRPAREEFTRTYLLHRRLYELFGLRTIPTLAHLARAAGNVHLTNQAGGGFQPIGRIIHRALEVSRQIAEAPARPPELVGSRG